jgi:hypothetical protein
VAVPSAAPAASEPKTDTGGGNAFDPAALSAPQIIYTGTLQLQVKDIATALVQARTAVVGLGGYVSGSQQSSSGERPVASITYRIPAAHWDEALTRLRALGQKVLSEQTQAQDVTGQVIDLGARIDNLQVTEKALQAIMARATKISDVLAVQQQLTDVRGQIEELTSQRDHLQGQVAYGTLTVGFEEPVVAVTQAQQGWDLGTQVDQAVAQLLEASQAAASVLIYAVIVVLPFALVALLLLGALIVAARRFGRRGRARDLVEAGGPPTS